MNSISESKNDQSRPLTESMKAEQLRQMDDEWDIIEEDSLANAQNWNIRSFGVGHSQKNVLVCNKGKPKSSSKPLENKYKLKIDRILSKDVDNVSISSASFESEDSVSPAGEGLLVAPKAAQKTARNQSPFKQDCVIKIMKLEKKWTEREITPQAPSKVKSSEISSPELMKRLLF